MERPEKPFTGKPMQEVVEIKNKYEDRFIDWSFFGKLRTWFRGYPTCNGIGIGADENEKNRFFVIHVYLAKEPSEKQMKKLPKELEGVPVKYEVTGDIVAAGA